MADKRKRTNLSIADKVKISDRLKNGSMKEDVTEFKIVQRTLQRIAKSEKEIRQDALSMQSTKKERKRARSLQRCRHSYGEVVYASTAERSETDCCFP